jgi:hypothetical protein
MPKADPEADQLSKAEKGAEVMELVWVEPV